jgi:hypothetical protein
MLDISFKILSKYKKLIYSQKRLECPMQKQISYCIIIFFYVMNVIIANSTHIDMVQQSSMATTHVAMMVAQEKT